MTLLRSKCSYCRHFKLHPGVTNRFICKLRLAEYGLVEQAEELETITLETLTTKIEGTSGYFSKEKEEQEESDDDSKLLDLKRRRNEFVRRIIAKFGGKRHLESLDRAKVESVSEYRRSIIKDFLKACTNNKRCGTCKGYEAARLSLVDAYIYLEYHLSGGKMGVTKFFESVCLCGIKHRWCKVASKLLIL